MFHLTTCVDNFFNRHHSDRYSDDWNLLGMLRKREAGFDNERAMRRYECVGGIVYFIFLWLATRACSL